MTEPLITLASLLEDGLRRTVRRLSLFLVLCLGAGLLMRLAYIPAEPVLELAFSYLPVAGKASEEELALSTAALNDGLGRLMLTQALLAVATAVSLVPWTRALEGRTSHWSGYSGMKMRRRMMRGALHLIVSVALSVFLTMAIMVGVQMFSKIVAIPLLFLQALFAGLAFWCVCFSFTVGHAAVVAEGRDRPVSMLRSLKSLRGMIAPAVAALVVITMAGIMIELMIGSLITLALPSAIQVTGGLILLFGVMYAVSAVHCATLLGIPDATATDP